MSSRKIIPLLLLFTAATTGMQAQNLLFGADFTTRFDNREYSGSEIGVSKTIFAARLTPHVGVQWQQKNRLVVGVDLLQDFGDDTGFLTRVRPLMYYRFNSDQVQANAGIFDRKELMGDYSRALFGSVYRFYQNRLSGFMGQYWSERHPDSYVEMTFDWEGMKSQTSREKFRLFSAGRYRFGDQRYDSHGYFGNYRGFYIGYALSIFHYAQSDLPDEQGIQDNLFANPYVGFGFEAFFRFDIKANFLVAPQRVRESGEGWKTPCGGQLDVSMTRWGVKIENNLYLGENLQPYYAYGGSAFYAGERFYGTTHHLYNRTKIGYNRVFFHGTVGVEASLAFQYDGRKMGTQQIVQLPIALDKSVNLSSKK